MADDPFNDPHNNPVREQVVYGPDGIHPTGQTLITFEDGTRAIREADGTVGPRYGAATTGAASGTVDNGGSVDFGSLTGAYDGPTLKQMLVAIGALAAITLLLPKKYGVWIPVFVLAGYGVTHTQTFNDLFGQLESLLPKVFTSTNNPDGSGI